MIDERFAPRLIVITDTSVAAEPELLSRIERVLVSAAPRTTVVQLRDHELSARERLSLGRRLVAACRRHDQYFVVNDRLDLAVLLDADGVHLGEASIAPDDARAMLPEDAWISTACHDAAVARRFDVDAVLVSPIALPRKGRPALGFEGLRAARRAIDSIPRADGPRLYALGGIDANNAGECLSAGADGVAAIGAVLDGRDPTPLLDALGIRRLD